jgi:hypothetical protein
VNGGVNPATPDAVDLTPLFLSRRFSDSGLPGRGILKPVDHREDFDSIRVYHVVANVAETFESHRADILPDYPNQFWKGLESLQHLAAPGGELCAKPYPHLFEVVMDFADIRLGIRAEDDWRNRSRVEGDERTRRH